MAEQTELTTLDALRRDRSFLFTATGPHGTSEEVVVVPCERGEDGTGADGPVRAYINRCTHESQRLDTGRGVAMRDGQIICPRHGSLFDSCTGYCDNGEAADTTLPSVEVAVDEGSVYLIDEEYAYEHDGAIGDGGDGPASSSHIGF